jgi:hypothetical protein
MEFLFEAFAGDDDDKIYFDNDEIPIENQLNFKLSEA